MIRLDSPLQRITRRPCRHRPAPLTTAAPPRSLASAHRRSPPVVGANNSQWRVIGGRMLGSRLSWEVPLPLGQPEALYQTICTSKAGQAPFGVLAQHSGCSWYIYCATLIHIDHYAMCTP